MANADDDIMPEGVLPARVAGKPLSVTNTDSPELAVPDAPQCPPIVETTTQPAPHAAPAAGRRKSRSKEMKTRTESTSTLGSTAALRSNKGQPKTQTSPYFDPHGLGNKQNTAQNKVRSA